MRQLILKMDCSLDGFVARPNGDLSWLLPDFDDEHAEWLVGRLWQAGAHLMGSATYRGMASHWPTSTEPYAAPMNGIPKIVFSHGPLATPWGETRVVCGDLAFEISRIKQEPGNPLLAHGGARFAEALVRSGLIDEYWLIIHPIALGSGLRLFPEVTAPIRLKPTSHTHFKTGVIATVLQPAPNQ
jgi:dihydrofolate reductase